MYVYVRKRGKEEKKSRRGVNGGRTQPKAFRRRLLTTVVKGNFKFLNAKSRKTAVAVLFPFHSISPLSSFTSNAEAEATSTIAHAIFAPN